MEYVDTHCHLDHHEETRPSEQIQRARTAGVATLVTVGTDLASSAEAVATASRYPNVWAVVGVHPNDAMEATPAVMECVEKLGRQQQVVGIGETGLDYYYDHSDRDHQRRSFRAHIAAARETQLPLIVHTRDAEEDSFDILAAQMGKGRFPALIHCFTGTRGFAEQVLELGLYVSISGIVTFKNARELQETAKAIPLDRLLIETDSPFLAPVPHRGKTCEPAFVADTARFLAHLRDEPLERLAEATGANFRRLFAKAAA